MIKIKYFFIVSHMDLRNKYPACREKRPTHVLMDGGSLYVPESKLSSFYKDYVSCVNAKRKLCVVEMNDPECFRYFLDLDYKISEPITHEYVQDITIKICRILSIGECIVSVGEPRVLADGRYKCGIHMNWSTVICNYDTAIGHRDTLIKSLGSEWSAILDKAVYKGGLRMPWAWKYDKETGNYHSPYLPLHIVSTDFDILDLSQRPDVYICRISSIHAPGKSESWFDRQEKLASDSTVSYVQKFLRANFPHREKCCVKDVFKPRGTDDLYIVNTDSRYCENKCGCHKSNHVYFVINSNGHCYQKCHDEQCEGFKGARYTVAQKLVEELFSK